MHSNQGTIWFEKEPHFYALFYLTLIPLYACIYYLFEELISGDGAINSLYFSVVTITTLGYGDLLPNNDAGKLIAASESVFGIVFIGLFLNSLSYRISEKTKAKDIKQQRDEYLDKEVYKITGFYLSYSYDLAHFTIASQLLLDKEDVSKAKFSDLSKLYENGNNFKLGFQESKVEVYFRCLDLLYNETKIIVQSVDMLQFPKLANGLSQIVHLYNTYNSKDVILKQTTMNIGKEPAARYISNMILNYDGDLEEKGYNLADPYIALYKQILELNELIPQLDEELQSILDSRVPA